MQVKEKSVNPWLVSRLYVVGLQRNATHGTVVHCWVMTNEYMRGANKYMQRVPAIIA